MLKKDGNVATTGKVTRSRHGTMTPLEAPRRIFGGPAFPTEGGSMRPAMYEYLTQICCIQANRTDSRCNLISSGSAGTCISLARNRKRLGRGAGKSGVGTLLGVYAVQV